MKINNARRRPPVLKQPPRRKTWIMPTLLPHRLWKPATHTHCGPGGSLMRSRGGAHAGRPHSLSPARFSTRVLFLLRGSQKHPCFSPRWRRGGDAGTVSRVRPGRPAVSWGRHGRRGARVGSVGVRLPAGRRAARARAPQRLGAARRSAALTTRRLVA